MGLFGNCIVSHKRQTISLGPGCLLYLGLAAKQGRFRKAAVCLTLETTVCSHQRQGPKPVSSNTSPHLMLTPSDVCQQRGTQKLFPALEYTPGAES